MPQILYLLLGLSLGTAARASSAISAASATALCGLQPADRAEPEATRVVAVTGDLSLTAGAVLRTPLSIQADGIVIEGNGAAIEGPGRPGLLESFSGAGIRAEGRSRIILRNIRVRGFACGLTASDGDAWRLEGCDFSDNYHDPEYGWGDGERQGGIILTRIDRSVITGNVANRVWNGIDLRDCDENLIERNDFSHCSNVCLKLWRSCRNRILDNNLSWGLRISPGEVHARDSTCVLIETGSDGNRFERNDITHGGDGVFIRPLNGWISRGNVFIGNDCSFANNNGFESWSPGNTFVRNRADGCSFGFWLGGSDHTVLIDNEASRNGLPTGKHNAPEPDFGHGGIVIVGGQGHHTVIDGNRCADNGGGGIVFRGDLPSAGKRWRMLSMIVQRNVLEGNEWGIFARFADGLFLSGNRFRANSKGDEYLQEVTGIIRGTRDPQRQGPPVARLEGPTRVRAGEPATFDASSSSDPLGRPLTHHFAIGETLYRSPRVEHAFSEPGFHRVRLIVTNGHLAGLAFLDVYAIGEAAESGTEGDAARWTSERPKEGASQHAAAISDDATCLVGKASVRVRADPSSGGALTASFRPQAKDSLDLDLSRKREVSFWLKFQNADNSGFHGPNPILRLHAGDCAFTYVPSRQGSPRNLLGDLPYAEARYGWLHLRVPLGGIDEWFRYETIGGKAPLHLAAGLSFETVETPISARGDSSIVSTGSRLFCISRDGDALFASEDGRTWEERRGPASALGSAARDWENGMLACYRDPSGKDLLILRAREPRRGEKGENAPRYTFYSVEDEKWSWTPTYATAGHGAIAAGEFLYGIAHAVGGNYGGPIIRCPAGRWPAADDRTTLVGLKGEAGSRWWFSRAAKLAHLGGKIYGIKNDWLTPQPSNPDESGDRLFAFDPSDYRPSAFSGEGGSLWDDRAWKAAETPCVDLGGLAFEVGHGSALVALPPGWSQGAGGGVGVGVGDRGGLFIVAGCSPSNHEGFGPPSDLFAIYDVAKGSLTQGRLPGPTGAGTSACFHRGCVAIKRGGMSYERPDRELWIATPLPPGEAVEASRRILRDRMRLDRVDRISFQFTAGSQEPFDVWIDGLAFR